ncbi:hypothetical protein Gpo141_00013902, partial [Globisporangium polare]
PHLSTFVCGSLAAILYVKIDAAIKRHPGFESPPFELSSFFERSVLRYWSKVSFSVYLLNSFVVYCETIHGQKNYYNALFTQFFLTFVLASASFHLSETPSQNALKPDQ